MPTRPHADRFKPNGLVQRGLTTVVVGLVLVVQGVADWLHEREERT